MLRHPHQPKLRIHTHLAKVRPKGLDRDGVVFRRIDAGLSNDAWQPQAAQQGREGLALLLLRVDKQGAVIDAQLLGALVVQGRLRVARGQHFQLRDRVLRRRLHRRPHTRRRHRAARHRRGRQSGIA